MKDIKWNKWGLWFVSVGNAARSVYPGLDGDMIVQAWHDGTLFAGALNVAFTLITARAAVLVDRKK